MATTSGYSDISGIATVATTAGYATTAGIATVAENVSETINITTTGIISASSYYGNGFGLTNLTANYADVAGIATVSEGLTGTPTINVNSLYATGISTIRNVSINTGIITALEAPDSKKDIISFWGDVSNSTSGRWVLVNNATDHYTFTGIGITSGNQDDPILYLARGRVYEFKNNVPNTHPFEIRLVSGGAAYSAGISTYLDNEDGVSVVTRFEIPFNAPNSLFYQCTSHASMGSTITIYPSI